MTDMELLCEIYSRLQTDDGDCISMCMEPDGEGEYQWSEASGHSGGFDLGTLPAHLWVALEDVFERYEEANRARV